MQRGIIIDRGLSAGILPGREYAALLFVAALRADKQVTTKWSFFVSSHKDGRFRFRYVAFVFVIYFSYV